MGNLPGRVPHNRRVAGQPVIRSNLRVGGHRADAHKIPGDSNTSKFVNTAQSDQS